MKKIIILSALVIFLALTLVVFVPQSTETSAEVLKFGSSGTLVTTVQTKLKRWGYYADSLDGIFGSKTLAAVKYFQNVNGLVADGIVGVKTAGAMGISLSNTSTTSSSSSSGYSSTDVYLLAKCIYAEARGEPYIGQVAVGAVVLNRVRSSKFPNTISGVIYEPYAFTCISDGQINLTPNDSAKRAAQDAMNGWDPSNGCLYYYNASTATSSWIWSRTIMLVIGKHNFAL